MASNLLPTNSSLNTTVNPLGPFSDGHNHHIILALFFVGLLLLILLFIYKCHHWVNGTGSLDLRPLRGDTSSLVQIQNTRVSDNHVNDNTNTGEASDFLIENPDNIDD